MNVLDESVPNDQRIQLTRWRVHTRKIGVDVGYLGILDENIMPLLHQLTRPTFFSRDKDFYKPTLRHADYCLVWLDAASHETALYIRRLLGHPAFNTEAKRLGHVIHVTANGVHYWRLRVASEQSSAWL